MEFCCTSNASPGYFWKPVGLGLKLDEPARIEAVAV